MYLSYNKIELGAYEMGQSVCVFCFVRAAPPQHLFSFLCALPPFPLAYHQVADSEQTAQSVIYL